MYSVIASKFCQSTSGAIWRHLLLLVRIIGHDEYNKEHQVSANPLNIAHKMADHFPTATGQALSTVKVRSSEQELVLWGSWFCPFVQRVSSHHIERITPEMSAV